jgi:hypothetical protein
VNSILIAQEEAGHRSGDLPSFLFCNLGYWFSLKLGREHIINKPQPGAVTTALMQGIFSD